MLITNFIGKGLKRLKEFHFLCESRGSLTGLPHTMNSTNFNLTLLSQDNRIQTLGMVIYTCVCKCTYYWIPLKPWPFYSCFLLNTKDIPQRALYLPIWFLLLLIRVLWSRPIPLAWYFAPQWEQKHGLLWPRALCDNWIRTDRYLR